MLRTFDIYYVSNIAYEWKDITLALILAYLDADILNNGSTKASLANYILV